jgi:ribosomal protein S18 acetylase RimI-like enzyme
MRLPPADDATRGHLNLTEFTREDARWQSPHEIVERDGILLVAGASDFLAFNNGVRRVDDRVPGADVVAAAHEFFGPRRRGFSAWTRTLPVDDDLAAATDDAGLAVFGDGAPQMICRAPVPERDLPAGVVLRVVASEADVADFARINGQAYTVYGAPADATASHFGGPNALASPDVHAVLADLDGVPVGAALALFSHGIAGVYWVAVLETARGRGVATAVMTEITNHAFARGAGSVQLQASPMGEPVYRRLGYEELYRYRLHLAMPPT